jgi:hypothetical protein
MDIGSCLLGGFNDDLPSDLLDIDGADEAPLLPVLVGRPRRRRRGEAMSKAALRCAKPSADSRDEVHFGVAIFTLTLGLVCVRAMLCVLYGVIVRPLAYDAGRVVVAWAGYEGGASGGTRLPSRRW